jgi:hypothetical protein
MEFTFSNRGSAATAAEDVKKMLLKKSPTKSSIRGSLAGTATPSGTHTAHTVPHSRTKKSVTTLQPESTSLDLHIQSITKDFCDWVAGIGRVAQSLFILGLIRINETYLP